MNGVNLTDALMRLPAINGPGASTTLGSGLVGASSGVSSSAGAAAGSLAGGPVGATLGAAAGSLIDNVFGIINTRSARKWQEKMYNEYNSPAALVRQYNEAGINPALMFGGSTPEMNTNTSAAPVSPIQTGTVADLLGQMMQLKLLDATAQKMGADTDAARAAAEESRASAAGKNIENIFKPDILLQSLKKGRVDIVQTRAAIDKILADIENTGADTDLKNAQRILTVANTALAKMQTDESYSRIGVNNATALDVTQDRFAKEFELAYRREFGGASPDANMPSQVLAIIRREASDARGAVREFADEVRDLGRSLRDGRGSSGSSHSGGSR